MSVTDDRGKVCKNFRIYYKRLRAGVAQSSREDYDTVSSEHKVKVMIRYLQSFSRTMREEKGGRLSVVMLSLSAICVRFRHLLLYSSDSTCI